METIRYSDILKESLRLTWENKFLWVFGLFIFLGTVPSSINTSMDEAQTRMAIDFIQNHLGLTMAGALAFVLVSVALYALRILGSAGIIKAAGDIAVYGQGTVRSIAEECKKHFWTLLLIDLLVNIMTGVIVVTLLVPIFYLFQLKAAALGMVSAAIAFFIFVPLFLLAYFIKKYAYIYAVLGGTGLRMSLEEAYVLSENNIKESVKMTLFSIGASLVFAICSVFVLVILGVVGVFIGVLAYFFLAKAAAFAIGAIVAIIAITVLLAASAAFEVFLQTAWVLFFKKIALKKSQEKKIAEERLESEKLPTPEPV